MGELEPHRTSDPSLCSLNLSRTASMIKNLFWSVFQVVVQLATFVTILCLNGLLLLTIIHQRQRRQNTLQAVPSGDASAKADWFALPMLGACVILYLITQLPGFFGSILYLLEKACYSQKSSQWQGALRPLQNICTNLYFSINFLLYCGVNARFRDTLAKLSRSLMRKIAILVRPVLDKRRSSDDSGKSTVTVTKPVSATTNLSSSLWLPSQLSFFTIKTFILNDAC